jgi:hypothetical protein
MTIEDVHGFCVTHSFVNLMWQRLRSKHCNGRRIVSVLLLGLFLSLLALTQIEPLHRWVHRDAGKHNHHCAVTHLRGGHADAPDCNVPVVRAESLPVTLVVNDCVFVSAVDVSLPPSCGPPGFPS